MNIQQASDAELVAFRQAIDAKIRELGAMRAQALAEFGPDGPRVVRARHIDSQLRDLRTVFMATTREALLRWRFRQHQPPAASRPSGYVSAAPHRLGIYEATPGRMLVMSRVSAVRSAGDPTVSIDTPNGPITVRDTPKRSAAGSVIWGVLAAASMGASAYHGVKRNHGSIGYGIWWGLMGSLFPVITPAVAVAQGFGKPGPR